MGDFRIARGFRRNSIRGVQGEWAGEDRKAIQQFLLRFAQEPIAPVERRAQCPLPRKSRTAPKGQSHEAVAQAEGHLLYAKLSGARRSELDGQWYAIEPPADRG